MKRSKKTSKKKKLLLTVVSLLIVGGLFYLAYSKGIINFGKEEDKNTDPEIKEEKKLKIVDLDSDSRSYAVMINNHSTARAHHAGLQDAYIIYELIVEGGMTRYLAIFKDQDTEKIGSVRSSRHYFLDYVLENDAIYIHWGYSPQAQSDMKSLKINHIDGIAYENSYFYRDKELRNSGVATEHTGFTTMELINKGAAKLKFRTTTAKDLLLDYSIEELELSKMANSQKADKVTIEYSTSVTDTYEYDSENMIYKRFVNNKIHKDDITKEQYTFKNIITYQVDNDKITGDDKGRQDLHNVGSGNGYYISSGYAVPITWEKRDRSSQTNYKYEDGSDLIVNDGNTFIQIQPKNQKLNISSNEVIESE